MGLSTFTSCFFAGYLADWHIFSIKIPKCFTPSSSQTGHSWAPGLGDHHAAGRRSIFDRWSVDGDDLKMAGLMAMGFNADLMVI